MVGRDVQHYRILRALGAGGMGVVFEAEDLRLGRRVALKFLPETSALSHEAVERFEREARIISQLTHPNICTLYDVGVDEAHGGRRFLVMELVDGVPLSARIAGTPLPVDQIVDVGAQLADALDVAHAHGIVHRDIKPANILLTKRGQSKLLDFGVAKSERDRAAPAADGETRVQDEVLTTPGAAIGSVNYMSPEQARGEDIDARSDLFSLGLVLYEMATGQQAFAGRTTAVVFDAILNRNPTAARTLNPSLPDDLDRVIARLLEKDRRLRYQTAADLAADLTRLRRDSTARAAAPLSAETAHTIASGPSSISFATPAAVSGPAVAAPPSPASGPAAASTSRPRRGLMIGLAAAIVAAAGGGFLLWRATRPPAFTERDTVVIADFANSTGDAVFDEALKQAVAVQLQQTPFVTVLPDQRVSRTLRLMQRPADQPVTTPIAREICERVGAKATVEGSIASLGSSYVITLGVHNCQTGASLAEQQVQATAKEGVLKAVGEAVGGVRQHLGESLASIQKYDVPITEASTSSLEALRAYGQANRTRATRGDEAAIPFYKQALEKDPNFALAYAKLSVISANGGNLADARTYGQQAYDLKDRVSEYERLYITWNYAARVKPDSKIERETLELMTTSYPNDYPARHNLGVYYLGQGELEKARDEFERASTLAPDEPLPIANLATTELALNHRPAAYAAARRALALRPDGPLAAAMYVGSTIGHDPDAAEFEGFARKMMPAPGWRAIQSGLARWRGQLKDYERLQAEDAAAARANQQEPRALGAENDVRITRAIFLRGPAVDALRASLRPDTPPSIAADDVAVLSALGRIDDVRDWLVTLAPEAKKDPKVALRLGVARAMADAAAGRSTDAIAAVEAMLDQTPSAAELNLYIGLMRERAGDLAAAAVNYQRVVSSTNLLGLSPSILLARLALAELLIKKGDPAGAKVHLDFLLDLWKNADPGLDLVERAKAARAKIKD